MTWGRLEEDMPGDPKIQAVSDPAFRLWMYSLCWCNKNLTGGRIPASTVPWLTRSQDPAKLAEELVHLKLWHLDDGCYRVNAWDDYNMAPEEVIAEREAAKTRMQILRKRSGEVRANKRRTTSELLPKFTDSGSGSGSGSDPISETGSGSKSNTEELGEPSLALSGQIRTVFDHYRTYHPQSKLRVDSPEGEKVRRLLKAGHTVEDCKLAIDGCHRSPFHAGQNDEGKKFQSLELIFRNESKLLGFIELAGDPLIPTHPKDQRTIDAVMRFTEMKRQNEGGAR